jgi:hypothetical protein
LTIGRRPRRASAPGAGGIAVAIIAWIAIAIANLAAMFRR